MRGSPYTSVSSRTCSFHSDGIDEPVWYANAPDLALPITLRLMAKARNAVTIVENKLQERFFKLYIPSNLL
jgi:hypothetical protein